MIKKHTPKTASPANTDNITTLITTISSRDINFLFDSDNKDSTSPIHSILNKFKHEIKKIFFIYNSEDQRNVLRGYVTEEKIGDYASKLCDCVGIAERPEFLFKKVEIREIQCYKTVFREFEGAFEGIRSKERQTSHTYETSPYLVNLSSGPQVYHSVLFFLAKSMLLAKTVITDADGTLTVDGDIGFTPSRVLHTSLQKSIVKSVNIKMVDIATKAMKEIDKNLIIDDGEEMSEVYARCAALQKLRFNVLLYGERGTGKEHTAKMIHNMRMVDKGVLRSGAPFIAINANAITESIFESELFGYTKGAFTGALKNGKPGLIDQAEGGTLFIDEIGDLSPFMQAKLLRFLETRTYFPVGETKEKKSNCLIITATNKQIERGWSVDFRPDLFDRLAEFTIKLVPIRERKSKDRIIEKTWETIHSEMKGAIGNDDLKEIPENIKKTLLNYSFPGNFRELRKLCIRILTSILIENAFSDKQKFLEITKNAIQTVPSATGLDDIDKVFHRLKTETWKFNQLNEILDELKLQAHKIRYSNANTNNLNAYAKELGVTNAYLCNAYEIDKENNFIRKV